MGLGPTGYCYQSWDYVDIIKSFDSEKRLIGEDIATECFDISMVNSTGSVIGTMLGGEKEINEARIEKIARKNLRFHSDNLQSDRCIYCRGVLTPLDDSSEYMFARSSIDGEELMFAQYSGTAAPTLHFHSEFEQRVLTCGYCSWWKMVILHDHKIFNNNSERGERRYGWNTGKKGLQEDVSHKIIAFGKMKEFDVGAVDVPLSELRSWLARHPNHVSHVDPFKFEEVIAQSLLDQGTYAEVRKVGGRGDRGIDIVLIDSDAGPILVQVKRRKNGQVEAVDTVRALNGVLLREGIPRGMVITTAGRFTRAAVCETAILQEGIYAKYRVDLHGLDFVENLLRTTWHNDPVPWRSQPADFDKLVPWITHERNLHGKPYRERVYAELAAAIIVPALGKKLAVLHHIDPRIGTIYFKATVGETTVDMKVYEWTVRDALPNNAWVCGSFREQFCAYLPTFALAAAKAIRRSTQYNEPIELIRCDFVACDDTRMWFRENNGRWDEGSQSVIFPGHFNQQTVEFSIGADLLARMANRTGDDLCGPEAVKAYELIQQALQCVAHAAYFSRSDRSGQFQLALTDFRANSKPV